MSVVAWPGWARALCALLTVLAFGNLLFIACLIVLDTLDGELRAPPVGVTNSVLLVSLLPLAIVALLRWRFSGRLSFEPDRWILQLRSTRFEIPAPSIARVAPWKLPLPGPGASIRLASGRTFERSLEGLLPGLPAEGRSEAFAQARARFHRSDVPAYLVKYLLFPMLPVAILFRLHQMITFGSPLGQWSLVGPGAWLRGLFEHGAATIAHLVVIAGVLRVLAELLALLGTALLPGSAIRIRQIAEWGVRVTYYGAIPALIGIAFFL